MIVSELFEGILLERRPDVVSELRKFASDPNVYITYVDVPKVGINPQTKFNTPLGIYAYPVQAYWNHIQHGSVPFAADRPYVYVLEARGNILDLATYTSSDFEADKETLHGLYGRTILPKVSSSYSEEDDDECWENFIEKTINKARPINTVTNPFAFAIWHVTMMVAAVLPGKIPNTWNSVFRALGYAGVSDKGGQGIIHPNEPTQTVFFSKQAVRVVEMLHNVRREPEETFGDYPVKFYGIDELTNILFYDDPSEGGDHSEKYKFLIKEWPELLLTGKSPHFAAQNTHDFFESFFSDDHMIGVRDGLAGFIPYVRLSAGAVSHLFDVGAAHPEAWPVIAAQFPEFIADANLSRSDIKRLMDPANLKLLNDAGANIGESIVKWALRPIYRNGQSRKERKAERSVSRDPAKDYSMTVNDVLSKIGPAAKDVLRLVPRERIQVMIDDAYEGSIPF